MKSLILCLTLISSLSAFAQELGWNCVVPEAHQAQVARLKLPGYLATIGILTVAPKHCSVIAPTIYSDVCRVKGHTITIGLNPAESLLTTKAGKYVPVLCEANREVEPFPAHGGSH